MHTQPVPKAVNQTDFRGDPYHDPSTTGILPLRERDKSTNFVRGLPSPTASSLFYVESSHLDDMTITRKQANCTLISTSSGMRN